MQEQVDRALEQLEADGLVTRDGAEIRTTRKWQGAMARAARHLYEMNEPGEDLRVPIAFALLQIYGDGLAEEQLAFRVEAMLPVEVSSLGLGAPTTP